MGAKSPKLRRTTRRKIEGKGRPRKRKKRSEEKKLPEKLHLGGKNFVKLFQGEENKGKGHKKT